jgi:hypothetical protein
MTSSEPVTHWLVFLATGWGCTGCDWTGTLDQYTDAHERQEHDIEF